MSSGNKHDNVLFFPPSWKKNKQVQELKPRDTNAEWKWRMVLTDE